jgi:hypothetical protein
LKKLSLFLLIALAMGFANSALGAPLYDPFLEKFQVGVYRDPDKIILEGGYPKDLMEMILPDSLWINAASQVLDPTGEGPYGNRTKSLLEGYFTSTAAIQNTLFHHHKRLRELQLTKLPAKRPYHVGGKFLLAERLAWRVFLAYEAGQYQSAAILADRLIEEGPDLGLKSRAIFVWDLRSRYLKSLATNKSSAGGPIWSSIFELGSFDMGNAWAIWVAYQKNLGLDIIPAGTADDGFAQFLGKLRKTWLSEKDISSAGFKAETYGALGAKILPREKLVAHFNKYPAVPGGLAMQGWWTGGQRRMNLGDATHYEKLAARNDLRPVWKMDIYRRASEIHLLAGRWSEGMVDLKEALLLAKNGHGTKSTRRRLRQWTEQAIALASAQGDTSQITDLLALGQSHFQGNDLSVFISQTERWKNGDQPESEQEKAFFLVSRGEAPDILARESEKAEVFAATADDHLWDLWFRWGRGISGNLPPHASKSYDLMVLGLGVTNETEKIDAILAIAAARFPDEGSRETLLRMTLEFDIGTLSGWTTRPWQSPMPDFIKNEAPGPKGLHALLGVALTTGDMRGILSAATKLPRKGLTREEKQRFLFPLPMKGPVRDAIEAAESDPALILAVAKNESLFDPAVRSRAGALGFMQIMPFHYDNRGANFGKDHWSQPAKAIAFGDRLLQEGAKRYSGNPYMSLAGYNAGPRPAARWLEQLGGVCSRQEYGSWIGYPETRYYVEKVLTDREIYHWIIANSGNEKDQ